MLFGEVECDELYLVAGHKGQPEKVREANREPRYRSPKRSAWTWNVSHRKTTCFWHDSTFR